jgi:hypothetical protein
VVVAPVGVGVVAAPVVVVVGAVAGAAAAVGCVARVRCGRMARRWPPRASAEATGTRSNTSTAAAATAAERTGSRDLMGLIPLLRKKAR